MTRTRLILAPLVLLALFAAGCGGGDDTKTVTVTQTASSEETTTATTAEDDGSLTEDEWTALNITDDELQDAVTTFQDSLTECAADTSTIRRCFARKYEPYGDAIDGILDALDEAQDVADGDCADALATVEDDAQELQDTSDTMMAAVDEGRYGDVDVDAWGSSFGTYRDDMDDALVTCETDDASASEEVADEPETPEADDGGENAVYNVMALLRGRQMAAKYCVRVIGSSIGVEPEPSRRLIEFKERFLSTAAIIARRSPDLDVNGQPLKAFLRDSAADLAEGDCDATAAQKLRDIAAGI